MNNSASYEIKIRRNMKRKGLKSAKNAAVAPPKETEHQCNRLALSDMIRSPVIIQPPDLCVTATS